MMARLIIVLFILLAGSTCFSQKCEDYQINSIDSVLLEKYFIVQVVDNKGMTKKIFSEKQKVKSDKIIKVGSKYCFRLEDFKLELDNDTTIKYRGNYAIFVDSKEVLGANEKSYKTINLKGLMYLKDPEN